MRIKGGITHFTLFALTLLLFSGGCALFKSHKETPVSKTALPSDQPAVHKLDFQSPGDERPKVAEKAPATPPVLTPPPVSLDEKAQTQVRVTAEQESRVRKELGERFVRLHTQNIRTGKVICPGIPPDPDLTLSVAERIPITKLTYYSYTNNMTVVVCMRGNELKSVGHRKGYQPAEGDEVGEGSVEFLQAEQLAREDKRLANQVGDLKAHVLLIEPARGLIFNEPGYGHRVFWVTFSKGDSGDPQFWAIVDLTLTDKQVLDAGTESQK